MKTRIYFIIGLAVSIAFKVQAQSIPNAGFETWTSFGTYSNPAGWGSYNAITASSGQFTTEQGSPGSAGASFLKLTIKNIPPFGIWPGIAVTAPTFPSGSNGGFPVSVRHANLTGKWQYKSTGADSMVVAVFMTKWNSTTMSRDNLGIGMTIIMGSTQTTWANFSVPITYYDGNTPDTATVMLIAGGGSTASMVVNDYLYADELAFSGIAAGIEEQENPLLMSVGPNPFSESTLVTFNTEQKNVKVEIINSLGQPVRKINFSGKELIIQREGLKDGVYFLNVTDRENSFSRKLLILK